MMAFCCWMYVLPSTLLPMVAMVTILATSVVAQSSPWTMVTLRDLNHQALSDDGQRLYVGAVNRLYVLDASDVRVVQEVVTGPRDDTQECPALTVVEWGCGEPLESTPNHNKILVVDTLHNQLITCGNVYQGTCELRSLQNISIATEHRAFHVAANDPSLSTVAFLGPKGSDNNALYVGTTYNEVNKFYKETTVSSRNTDTDRPLRFSEDDIFEERNTYIQLPPDIVNEYIITYKSGFSYDGYSYFVTTQQATVTPTFETNYITKIVQVCQNHFRCSYIEMPLNCMDGSTDYNVAQAAVLTTPGSDLAQELGISSNIPVLIGLFAKSDSDISDEPTNNMAVCIYQIADIRQKFTENLKSCFRNGATQPLGQQFGADRKCRPSSTPITENYCGEAPGCINSPLSGTQQLTATPVLAMSNQAPPTAIAIDIVNNRHTVAFIGLGNGHLKKVLLKSPSSRVITDMTVDEGSVILSDLLLSHDKTHLYVMTQHKISLVPVSDCGSETTCDSCHGIDDPYCGWCSLQKKCSVISECEDSADSLRWLTAKEDCIEVTNVQPMIANIHIPKTVTVTIRQLPPAEQYMCVYSTQDAMISENATVSGPDTISCPTLSNNSGLRISDDHINVTLSVKSVSTEVSFLEEDFTFYSCSEHVSCAQCTSSQFPCHWCLHGDRCRDQSEICMESGSILAGNQSQCPQLDNVRTNKLLLPTGVPRNYMIQGRNLQNNNMYRCRLYANEDDTSAVGSFEGAFINNTHIQCQGVQYNIPANTKTQPMVMRVFWKESIQVDNSVDAQAYSCRAIASDCSSCFSQPDETFECRWCPADSGTCFYKSECRVQTSDMCPPAKIDSVEPDMFPVDGGSIITISGTNLGQYEDDILSIRIVDRLCNLMVYEASRKILCQTSDVSMSQEGGVAIQYKYMNGDTTVPYRPVYYKNPSISEVSPLQGPQSGGTRFTITGQELDTGANITVTLAGMPCEINERSDEELICTTEWTSINPSIGAVSVVFDTAARSVSQRFTIRPDPVVESIGPLAVFESGGRVITIQGSDLNSVVTPVIRLVRGDYTSPESVCRKLSDRRLECPSPEVPLNATATNTRRRRRQADNNEFTLTLTMDGVNCTNYISACYKTNGDPVNDLVRVVQDPVYHLFEGGVMKFEGNVLTLTGERLNLASRPEEVNVTIGSENCIVDSLSEDKLLCTPPKKQPQGSKSGELPDVRVRVGHIDKTLGRLEWTKKGIATEVWIIVLAVGGGTLITIIIIVVAVYKRRSADVERQNKKLQIQLDNLESNVRNECKQAFAELQTEVSDFTSDLNVIGIPFWDYKMYTFRVLFPGLKDHPVLHQNDSVNKFGGIDQGLHQFSQLLNSKQFLLIFIRTLEQQKNFSIRDKSVVASLLMIVLQDKMEYATDILKSLLNELIDKSVEKKHPKLMLRRTESVVEKLLSNWLSLSMYTYLKKHAGKVLFMLFKAIKHQTEKGPIDVFTSEAKYSLSEDRLLREKVEPKTLTLHVFMNDMKEPATFKALDNDTITQAKEKALDAIYMNSPFSPRPSVYDVELEWRSGRSGHLPLQDEDVTTQADQGWKRVNTLLHYHVPDGASLVLVPSKSKNDLVHKKHGMIEIGGFQSSLPPIVTVEEGTKVWHLVKHDDNQNVQRTQKVISEIFLTRLLATKGTLQQYIDDLFMTVLRADQGLPPAVKYLFDFLDTAARRHNLVDADVVHTWKSNSLPLRFWVNIIKNPEFIFDIHKSNIVDSCLSVIAQTFMDSCSTAEHRLGKDSPSNKLLFAKDIPRYRGWVSKFYKSVQDMSPISDQDMTRVMMEMSMTNFTDFNVSVALQDLYKYAMQYNFELLEALDDDPSAKRLHLANRFEQVQAVIEGTPLY